jgi:hypothetical protein
MTSQDKPRCARCGATLGRTGKCPALCTPVPAPLPHYRGAAVIGRSHVGRLAAPVQPARGWIGGDPSGDHG